MARPVALRRTPLPRSKHVLLLVDVINPLNFSTAADLLPGAVRAANAIARLKTRLARRGVTAIYANDNYATARGTATSVTFSRPAARCRGRAAKWPACSRPRRRIW